MNEFIDSKITVKSIIISNDWRNKNNIDAISHEEILIADNREFQQISSQKNPEGILAVCQMPDIQDISLIENHWAIALDTIQDPGNLGTIIRIADWFGIEQIFCSNETADCYNSKVVQSTMGSLARIQCIYTDLEKLLENYKGFAYAATLGGQSIYELEAGEKGILVIGNESHGISDKLLPYCNQKISIPRLGKAESLNAGIATGILLSWLVS